MIHSGVSKRLFFYAVRHFYYHWMRDESAGVSRWEKFSEEKLETKMFYPFGCLVTAVMGERGKLQLQAYGGQLCFLGYAEDFKRSYYLYNPITKRVVIRGDVASLIFVPNKFPFS